MNIMTKEEAAKFINCNVDDSIDFIKKKYEDKLLEVEGLPSTGAGGQRKKDQEKKLKDAIKALVPVDAFKILVPVDTDSDEIEIIEVVKPPVLDVSQPSKTDWKLIDSRYILGGGLVLLCFLVFFLLRYCSGEKVEESTTTSVVINPIEDPVETSIIENPDKFQDELDIENEVKDEVKVVIGSFFELINVFVSNEAKAYKNSRVSDFSKLFTSEALSQPDVIEVTNRSNDKVILTKHDVKGYAARLIEKKLNGAVFIQNGEPRIEFKRGKEGFIEKVEATVNQGVRHYKAAAIISGDNTTKEFNMDVKIDKDSNGELKVEVKIIKISANLNSTKNIQVK